MKIKLIIGIGNPDEQYQNTRHNVGFMFLDYLAQKLKASDFSTGGGPSSGWELEKKLNSLVSKTKLEKTPAILVKPQTYVNKTGSAAAKLKNFYKVKPEDIIVIQDDLDIPFGNTKLSFAKNSGGHKGIESIMKAIKTKNFYRLRIGLGIKTLQKARQQSDKNRDEFVRNYVLSKFSKSESEKLKEIFKETYDKLLSNMR